MNAIEQARFNPLYEQMLQALKLQGKRPKTIGACGNGKMPTAEQHLDTEANNGGAADNGTAPHRRVEISIVRFPRANKTAELATDCSRAGYVVL